MVGDAVFPAVFFRKDVVVLRGFLLGYRKRFDVPGFSKGIENQRRIESAGKEHSYRFFIPDFRKYAQERRPVFGFEIPDVLGFGKTHRKNRYRFADFYFPVPRFEFSKGSEFEVSNRIEKRDVRRRRFENERLVDGLAVDRYFRSESPQDRFYRPHVGSDDEMTLVDGVVRWEYSERIARDFHGISHGVEPDCRKTVRRLLFAFGRKRVRISVLTSKEIRTVGKFFQSAVKEGRAFHWVRGFPVPARFRKGFRRLSAHRGEVEQISRSHALFYGSNAYPYYAFSR